MHSSSPDGTFGTVEAPEITAGGRGSAEEN